ncbi:HHIP-like protein 2 isoform X2 [Tubulanus polymorphus]|uniref:HHIP-like protein 2 isoform X2 n=1 Tax=Tubulanus polymorphus TaxID=672921 RepID=UPI003DA2F2FD
MKTMVSLRSISRFKDYFWVFLTVVSGVTSHPMCLDFRPPFNGAETLQLCPEYRSFGCCTVRDDTRLMATFKNYTNQVTHMNKMACLPYVKRIMCQECSPYAAHLFSSETGNKRNLPGLCRDYCSELYQNCKDVIPTVTSEPAVLKALKSEAEFCKTMELPDKTYCYPDLLNNDRFINEISWTTTHKSECLCLEQFDTGLRNPVMLKTAGDDSGRLFIGEQIGLVHIYLNKQKLLHPFLDIRDKVLTSSSQGDERGFLGLIFHPNYRHNGLLYVYYSVDTGGNHDKTRVSEFRVSKHDKNRVDHNSERTILDIDQPFWNHNGGELLFGSDGYLYLSTGDGGHGGDPYGHAQNKGVLLGKILRIDIDKQDVNKSYSIPPDNPFVGNSSARPEIYAYGIRNAWRCSIDRGNRKTGVGKGRIFCGDVGQARYEEIDLIVKGGNYGWSAREGFECYNKNLCNTIEGDIRPIYAYDHKVGQSVTGGYVYRGCLNPNLEGLYIFGDFMTGKLFSLEEKEGKWSRKDIRMCNRQRCPAPLMINYERNIISFGEDESGELYMLTTDFASATHPSGKVYKLIDPARRGDPSTCNGHPDPRTTRPHTVITIRPNIKPDPINNDQDTGTGLARGHNEGNPDKNKGPLNRPSCFAVILYVLLASRLIM